MARSSLAPVTFSLENRDRHRAATRLTLIGLLAGAVLAVAGLPRIDLHGPLHYVGIMDPLCGGTRAAFLLSRGQWARAWTYNPIVFPLVIGAVLVLVRAAVGWSIGRWVTVRITRRGLLIVALVLALAVLEVRQQLRADLLTAAWPS